MHTDALTYGKARVLVRMHVKVRDQAQLLYQKLWTVQVLAANQELDLLLTPAPENARANIATMWLECTDRKRRLYSIQFQTLRPKKEQPLSLFERRLRLAESQIGRRLSA